MLPRRLQLRLQLLLLLRCMAELCLQPEVGTEQLRMCKGALGLQAAIVAHAEEDEQKSGDQDKAGGGGAHRETMPEDVNREDGGV